MTTTRRSSSVGPNPPGPSGLPLLGNIPEFRRDPTAFLTQLARDYGDVAHFRLGRRHAYQLNHPDFIRDVLVTHSRNFQKTGGLNRAATVVGKGLLTSEGDFHRRQRRLVQPAFKRDRIAAYGESMAAYAARTSERWQPGQNVDMLSEMLRLTLAIVGETLFGVDIESDAEDIGWAMTEVFEHFNRLLMPFSGVLARAPLPSSKRFVRARQLLDSTVYRIITERRGDGEDRGDLLSMLLMARDEGYGGGQMTDTQVRDEIMTGFLAGHETTATALTWTWYLLARNPEVSATLQSELDGVLGGRLPACDDIERLPYTQMVLMESMRLFPPVWTLTRKAMDDYEVGGYTLPAGSTVGMSQFVMHRDERFYTDPERFDPLRWEPEKVADRPRYSYFPFGGGPRLCIGEAFAKMEATLLLATLCQFWEAELPDGYEPQMQPLITLRPKGGLPVRLRRREPSRSSSTVSVQAAAGSAEQGHPRHLPLS